LHLESIKASSGRKPNPPYSRNLMSRFVDKLLCEIDCGRVTEAIVSRTTLLTQAGFIACRELRPRSVSPAVVLNSYVQTEPTGSPAQGQVFHFLGENADRFLEVFREPGFIAAPHRKARQ
jgi:hypothetical protein